MDVHRRSERQLELTEVERALAALVDPGPAGLRPATSGGQELDEPVDLRFGLANHDAPVRVALGRHAGELHRT